MSERNLYCLQRSIEDILVEQDFHNHRSIESPINNITLLYITHVNKISFQFPLPLSKTPFEEFWLRHHSFQTENSNQHNILCQNQHTLGKEKREKLNI